MINNLYRQGGAIAPSVLGSLILLVFVLIFAGKLVPVYLDNKSVKLMLEKYENDDNLVFTSPLEVRNRIAKQLRVDGVKTVRGEDSISVERGKDTFDVDITYQVKIPLAYNIEMLVSFSDQAEIPHR
ncbi:MAG: DUF4845 domain-containing protein [Gammaproteobacteria bacterium]|nr:DUF4845 domain-containing protein [Gammaproteobacteria bacterium]